MKKQLLSFLFVVYLPHFVVAQHLTDSVQHLPEVKIQAEQALGNRSIHAHATDTIPFLRLMQSTTAAIVNDDGSSYVRNYGPGNIATISVNGTGPAQTTVEWNDLPLNNPSHGVTDLSIQPAFLTDRVTISEGALGNSGAIIELKSFAPFDSGMHVQQYFAVGSFGRQESGTGIRYYNGVVATQTRFYRMEARNDFPMQDADGRSRNQLHAAQQQIGLAHDLSVKAGKGLIEAHVLLQSGDREIPPLMLNTNTSKKQWDESYRCAVDYLRVNRRASHKFSIGALTEVIRYRDTLIHTDDTSRSTVFMAGYTSRLQLSEQLFLRVQVRSLVSRIEVPEYNNDEQRVQSDASAGFSWMKENVELTAAINGVSAGSGLQRLYPSCGVYTSLNKHITLRANASGTYRIPTFNDLYWQPGGNTQLEPERGVVSSGAVLLHGTVGVFNWKAEQGFFYTHTANAIVWVPDNNGVYAAHNIHELRTDGAQGLYALDVKIRQLTVSAAVGVQYTQSVIVKSSSEFRSAIGKQMVYVPDWMVRPVITASWHHWVVRLSQENTGTRFTVADHSEWIDPYSLTNFVVMKTIPGQRCDVTAGLQVNNIFSTNYQSIAWQAMPRRSFGLSLQVEFH